LKPEQWGSLLFQEKYQEEKACVKRHPYRKISRTTTAAAAAAATTRTIMSMVNCDKMDTHIIEQQKKVPLLAYFSMCVFKI